MRLSIAALLLVNGCLPGDLRPEPASLYVTAEPSAATTQGFVTADGWNVRFDRFVTAVGDIRLHGAPDGDRSLETCNDYAETRYDWLFDFTLMTGPQKVGLTYGLGLCSMEFRFREPRTDTVLGVGTTQHDVDVMRTRGSDAFTMDEEIAVMVQGQAERDGVVKRFDWAFRRSYELSKCPALGEDGYMSVLQMYTGDELSLAVLVMGEELFRVAPIDEAPLEFNRFAEADDAGDGDGNVTLVEMGKVDAPAYEWPPDKLPPPSNVETKPPTLADIVYQLDLPRLARLIGGGWCEPELRERFR